MKFYECPVCHNNVDAGEMINGVCFDCFEKKEREADIQSRFSRLVMSVDYKQMEMEEYLK